MVGSGQGLFVPALGRDQIPEIGPHNHAGQYAEASEPELVLLLSEH